MADTKKFKRKLTPFLCQEMLNDYSLGRLDPDRRQAVEDFLKTDEESRRVLEAIRRGQNYSATLSKTQLKPEILAHIRESENAISIGRKYSSWQEWPEAFRWSVTAIALSAIVAAIVAVIPWSRIPSFKPKRSDSIEIAEIPRVGEKAPDSPQDDAEANAAEEGSGDDEIEAPDATDAVPVKAKGKIAAQASSDEGDEGEDVPAAPVKAAKPTPLPTSLPKPTAVAAVVPASSPAVDEEDETKKDAKAQGVVFRAFMTLPNLDEVGPKISDSVIELGGEKAGEVELGWKRGTGRYYHFVMPEENEEKLLEKLRAYGPVRLSKDPHPRVMPKGQVRFILWVESAR